MTNREAFNKFFRESIEAQIAYMESMSNEELVDYTIKVPGYHVEANVGDMIINFKIGKCNATPIGNRDEIVSWFDAKFNK